MPFSAIQLLALAAIGLVAGVIGGLLGVGGRHHHDPRHDLRAARRTAAPVPGRRHDRQRLRRRAGGGAAWLAKAVVRPIIRYLVPGAVAGVIVGVALSNIAFFRGENAERLARLFAFFLAYVTVYNVYRLIQGNRVVDATADELRDTPPRRTFVVGC